MVSICVGSCQTRVWYNNELIFSQKSCLAVRKKTKELLFLGDKAWDSYEKAPDAIDVIFPVVRSEVADIFSFQLFMTGLLQVIKSSVLKKQQYFSRWSIEFLLPLDLSPAKRKITEEVLLESGFSEILCQSELESQGKALQAKVAGADYCIVNIGCQQTQIGLFSSGSLVLGTRFFWGGQGYSDVVQKKIRETLKTDISMKTTEEVKKTLATLSKIKQKKGNKKKTVVGRSTIEHITQSVLVSSDMFISEFEEHSSVLVENIRQFFSTATPSLVTDCVAGGIFITGGGSKLHGLDSFLSTRLKSQVVTI